MKTTLLCVFAIVVANAVFAQNWSPINTEETFYYNSGGVELTGIRVDSVAVMGGDIVWYPSRLAEEISEMEPTEGDCPATYSVTSIIGAGLFQGEIVLIDNDGFLFQNPDTFLIFPQASLGIEWTFSALSGQIPVMAEILALGEAEVMGVLDSVKTIGLSDGRTIELSKNHGIMSFESTDGVNYNLSGIPDRQLGIYPIGRFEVFDFEVGDVFVYMISNSLSSDAYSHGIERIEITDVLDNGNGNFEYSYNRAIYRRIWELVQAAPGVWFYEEVAPMYGEGGFIAEMNIVELHLCDAIPGTYFSQEEGVMNNLLWLDNFQDGWFGYHKNVYTDAINNRESKVVGGSEAFSPSLIAAAEIFVQNETFPNFENDVLFQQFDLFPFGDGSLADIGDTATIFFSEILCGDITASTAFAKGLGIVSTIVFTGLNYSSSAMVGYSKGTEEFGFVPSSLQVVSVGTDELSVLPQITVYPVPATDILHFSHHIASEYCVFDITGKPVLRGMLNESFINISNLSSGLYHGQLLQNGVPTATFRFLK